MIVHVYSLYDFICKRCNPHLISTAFHAQWPDQTSPPYLGGRKSQDRLVHVGAVHPTKPATNAACFMWRWPAMSWLNHAMHEKGFATCFSFTKLHVT